MLLGLNIAKDSGRHVCPGSLCGWATVTHARLTLSCNSHDNDKDGRRMESHGRDKNRALIGGSDGGLEGAPAKTAPSSLVVQVDDGGGPACRCVTRLENSRHDETASQDCTGEARVRDWIPRKTYVSQIDQPPDDVESLSGLSRFAAKRKLKFMGRIRASMR